MVKVSERYSLKTLVSFLRTPVICVALFCALPSSATAERWNQQLEPVDELSTCSIKCTCNCEQTGSVKNLINPGSGDTWYEVDVEPKKTCADHSGITGCLGTDPDDQSSGRKEGYLMNCEKRHVGNGGDEDLCAF